MVITTGGTGFTGRDVTPEAVEPLFEKKMDGFATMFLLVSEKKIGTSAIQTRATAGVANATYVFCLPGSPGACKDAWDEILVHQLDYRYRPCNFVEILPRLGRASAAAQGERRDRLARRQGRFRLFKRSAGEACRCRIYLWRRSLAGAQAALDRAHARARGSAQHQAATSEILGSISGSPSVAMPVFDALVRNLPRRFGTIFASVQLLRAERLNAGAYGAPGMSGLRKPLRPLDDATVCGQAILRRHVCSILRGRTGLPKAAQQMARMRINASVAGPLIREGKVFGAIICRSASRASSPTKQSR